ncbi:serine--tRNA ligase [Alkalitalea saponilacus]|uniref:Serine--tRNA ligase n=1 Tax=Alkalitalea saponilacus TaxID=889453 RepID=A0A1T5A797_9BACT|nr:serine--tRNA ligase [Alkalitalea saponilacus]ASB48818.1 serine--tRNA ligase [Alkalitalea saponilacus]SKB30902.1 seryl-tRNA synthetase [Alkalitalea saponilacus]
MLTLKQIQDNKQEVIERLKIKNFDAVNIVDQIIELDNKRKSTQTEADNLQAEMNRLSKSIGQLFKEGKAEEANQAKETTAGLKEQIKNLTTQQDSIETELQNLVVQLPNLPHPSVPAGKSADDNIKVREGGLIPQLTEALPHWELAKKFNLIDFELGVKLTGAGFPVYKGHGARLQRALIAFFLDEAIAAGYEEVMPPLMVNEDSGFGTGQLPDKEGQMYHVTADNLYLIPTAEVPVTNIYRDVILDGNQLPVRNCAYSACFRREAGSYGKDVRGLNRLHQFDKVEIVQVAHPEKSYVVLDEMVNHVQSLVEKLGLPWRIMRLCGGDMSFASALTFDFEVYSGAQERWLEVSSVSNFETFQSNRLKLRFREEGEKKTQLAHTLNGSALALPRILAAILENNQFEGGIKIPDVLVPYCGFDVIA